MNATDQFEDLRPFVADEIPAAMQRIADSEAFDALARYVFPHRDVEEVRRMVRAIRTTDEFQMSVMDHPPHHHTPDSRRAGRPQPGGAIPLHL